MSGSHVGTLRVKLRYQKPEEYDQLVWMVVGHQGDHWKEGRVLLHKSLKLYQVWIRPQRDDWGFGTLGCVECFPTLNCCLCNVCLGDISHYLLDDSREKEKKLHYNTFLRCQGYPSFHLNLFFLDEKWMWGEVWIISAIDREEWFSCVYVQSHEFNSREVLWTYAEASAERTSVSINVEDRALKYCENHLIFSGDFWRWNWERKPWWDRCGWHQY